jgi:hypothetical protein
MPGSETGRVKLFLMLDMHLFVVPRMRVGYIPVHIPVAEEKRHAAAVSTASTARLPSLNQYLTSFAHSPHTPTSPTLKSEGVNRTKNTKYDGSVNVLHDVCPIVRIRKAGPRAFMPTGFHAIQHGHGTRCSRTVEQSSRRRWSIRRCDA